MRIEDRKHTIKDMDGYSIKKVKNRAKDRVTSTGKFSLHQDSGGAQQEQVLADFKDKIKKKGEKLKQHPSLETAGEYKTIVEELLAYIVENAYTLKDRSRRTFKADSDVTVKVIVRINDELEKLMLEVIKEQRDKLRIVEKVGMINGLIIDLLK